MNEALASARVFVIEQLPGLIIPIAILVVGWLLAVVSSWVAARTVRRVGVSRWLASRALGRESAEDRVNAERWASKATYYVVLLFTLLGFLQAVNLTAATEPVNALLSAVFAFVPQLIGATVVLLVGWLAATVVRRLLSAALRRWNVDAQITTATGEERARESTAVSDVTAQIAFWLVLLLFVPAALSALRLEGMLVPFRGLVEETLGFLPNLGSAALVLAGGWFLARVLQRLVTNLLLGIGTEKLRERIGMEPAPESGRSLSATIGNVVYGLTLIPVAVAALNALRLEAVTGPASAMLSAFFAAVPKIFAAVVVVAIGYVTGRLLSSVASSLLSSVGFDQILSKIGVTRARLGDRTLSQLCGSLIMLAVIYFACMEAAALLGLETVAAIAAEVAVFAGRLLLGIIIFGFGLFLAQVAATAVRESAASYARTLSMVVRVAVLALAGAMALRQLGLANEIIILTFGLGLGAVAVAGAIAFGLGGRDVAAQAIEDARRQFQHAKTHEPVVGPPQLPSQH